VYIYIYIYIHTCIARPADALGLAHPARLFAALYAAVGRSGATKGGVDILQSIDGPLLRRWHWHNGPGLSDAALFVVDGVLAHGAQHIIVQMLRQSYDISLTTYSP